MEYSLFISDKKDQNETLHSYLGKGFKAQNDE